MKKLFLLLFLILVMINNNKAQKPDFGTATDFAVFTTIGAFANSGNSQITGNIGTNTGTLTGFPPGIVIGTTHIADDVSLQVSNDLESAYTFMTSLTCDSTISSGLGSGQILPPNIYCLGSASTLTGNLTLDAKGDADAIFIFKIDGAFTAATFTNISLFNSASYCNVFWQVNGAFILGAGSTFKGNLICNGALSLFEASSVQGKTLTKAGAIDTHNNLIEIDPAGCLYSNLPIQLVFFNSLCQDENVILEWRSATETNNDFYTIERSNDYSNWEILQKLNGAGNSSQETNYTLTDTIPFFGKTFYRLSQTDFNGMTQYRAITSIENCRIETHLIMAFPNPSTGIIRLIDEPDFFNSVSILNSMGERIFHSINYPTEIDLLNETAGIYFLQLTLNNEIYIQKIILE